MRNCLTDQSAAVDLYDWTNFGSHDEVTAFDLQRCRGWEVRSDLRTYLATAHTSEEIARRCLD